MSCRTCRWLVVHPDKDGRVRIRRDEAYLCDAPVGALPLPDSVTRYHSFRPTFPRVRMSPDEGIECPTYEPRRKEKP